MSVPPSATTDVWCISHNSPPGPDGGEHLLHHLAEVRGGQRLDCVDGAVGRVVVIHLVLGERHLGVLFIVGSDPVDGQLYLRSKGERRWKILTKRTRRKVIWLTCFPGGSGAAAGGRMPRRGGRWAAWGRGAACRGWTACAPAPECSQRSCETQGWRFLWVLHESKNIEGKAYWTYFFQINYFSSEIFANFLGG